MIKKVILLQKKDCKEKLVDKSRNNF